MRRTIAACLFWAACTEASAGIVYQWETLSTSPTISSAIGRIEISDAAHAAGKANYTAPPRCVYQAGCNYGDSSSPVISFYFRVNSQLPTAADIDLHLVQGTGTLFPLDEWFRANFTISGNILNLDVFAHTGETDMRMDGNSITRFGSDAPVFGDDCFMNGCSGATGRWVQAQVPEPGSVALFAIGALIASILRLGRQAPAACALASGKPDKVMAPEVELVQARPLRARSWHAIDAMQASSACGATGLTRYTSKPASSALMLSSSCP